MYGRPLESRRYQRGLSPEGARIQAAPGSSRQFSQMFHPGLLFYRFEFLELRLECMVDDRDIGKDGDELHAHRNHPAHVILRFRHVSPGGDAGSVDLPDTFLHALSDFGMIDLPWHTERLGKILRADVDDIDRVPDSTDSENPVEVLYPFLSFENQADDRPFVLVYGMTGHVVQRIPSRSRVG